MLQLCARANELKHERYPEHEDDITPTQVERWSAYEGLLPSVRRPGRGRGAGREADYTERYMERLVEVAVRVRRGRPLSRTVLWLFGDGVDLDEPAIRRAYTEALSGTQDVLGNAMNHVTARLGTEGQQVGEATAEDAIDMLEPEFAKHLRTIQGGGMTKRQGAAQLFGRVTFGIPVDPEELIRWFNDVGVPPRAASDVHAARDITRALGRASIEERRSVLNNSSIVELREFRDLARALMFEALPIAMRDQPELFELSVAKTLLTELGVQVAMFALMIGAGKRAFLESQRQPKTDMI